MIQFRFIFASLFIFGITACSTSPTESGAGNSNKIPANFKGTWKLTRITCPNGATGSLADFINTNLNNETSNTKLTVLFSEIQGPDVTSTVTTGQGSTAAACIYSVVQHWEKEGHWVQISTPDIIKTGVTTAEPCETKKKEFATSDIFKYVVPVGELSYESKNGLLYLYRTVGRSEKDLNICQTSDRFIYELKKRDD